MTEHHEATALPVYRVLPCPVSAVSWRPRRLVHRAFRLPAGPQRPLTETEHRQMGEYLEASGIEDGFCQDLAAATEEMIPQFNMTDV